MNRAAWSGARPATSATTPPFTDPTSVTKGTPASRSCTTTSAITPTGNATNAASAPAAASSTEVATEPTAPEFQRVRQPVTVAVEADDVMTEPGQRETDRAADQAGADDRDAHDYSGRSSRSERAPSRYT